MCLLGYHGLSAQFAERVELELVYPELQARVASPPSREVFLEERRRRAELLGRKVSLRETLAGLIGQTGR